MNRNVPIHINLPAADMMQRDFHRYKNNTGLRLEDSSDDIELAQNVKP